MKLTLTNLTLIAALTGFAAGGAAFANQSSDKPGSGDRKPHAERMFEQMDTDGDGKVTAEDAKAFAAKRFGERDIDGNGVISREDRQQFRAKQREERRTERFSKIDTDGDGMISLEEFKQAKSERRGRGMRGSRGEGERAERSEGRRGHGGWGMRGGRHGHGMHGMRGHHGHGKGMRHDGWMGGGSRMGGVLTIQEAEARAMQRFERIDADNDGVITLEDIKAFKPGKGRRNRND